MKHGWFKVDGVQGGDRSLDDQLKGLQRLTDSVKGCTVLDLGCAEGLLMRHLMQQGAARVYGLEVVPQAVRVARTVLQGYASQAQVHQQDLNRTEGTDALLEEVGKVDVCLMLAILHKLQNPSQLLAQVLVHNHPHTIVLRMPKGTPGYVEDPRSKFRRFDINGQLNVAGYTLVHTDVGHFDEWVGYYNHA